MSTAAPHSGLHVYPGEGTHYTKVATYALQFWPHNFDAYLHLMGKTEKFFYFDPFFVKTWPRDLHIGLAATFLKPSLWLLIDPGDPWQ